MSLWKRKDDEDFPTYRARRSIQQALIKDALRGRMFWLSKGQLLKNEDGKWVRGKSQGTYVNTDKRKK